MRLSLRYNSNRPGFIPRITLYSTDPILNSISTLVSLSLILLTNCDLVTLRNGLLNNPKHKASNIVLFPAPLFPIIKVDGVSRKLISVN